MLVPTIGNGEGFAERGLCFLVLRRMACDVRNLLAHLLP